MALGFKQPVFYREAIVMEESGSVKMYPLHQLRQES
jgi:hypothetical protein